MNTITLSNVLPSVFRTRDSIASDVWHRELTFERGHSYLVRASSGTGKSSLCSFIMGQRSDYEGIITFDGTNIRILKPSDWTRLRQRTISHMYQELRLFPELTAIENVRIKNTLTGHLKKKQIRRWFDELGISDKTDTPVSLMSFGQQQRVAFIRALAQPFDFLIIDEPISHLDDANAAIMSRIIQEQLRENGAALIVTSIGRDLPIPYDVTLDM